MDSPFGAYFRDLRERHSETQNDAAKWLGVRLSELSAVEGGRSPLPGEWIPRIISHYSLNPKEADKLRKTAVSNSFFRNR